MATSRRTFRDATRIRRVAGSGAALIFAAAGLLLTAGVVSAHELAASLTCGENNSPGLNIALGDFSADVTNTVAASIDGVSVLPVTTFTTSYTSQIPAGDATVGHTAVVNVTAGDDPTGSNGWTREFDLTVDPCQDATSTPPSSAPSTAPSSAPSTAPSTAPSASPSGGVEAATATPHATVPATGTADQAPPSGPSSSLGFLLILFAVVALVAAFAPVATSQGPTGTKPRRR